MATKNCSELFMAGQNEAADCSWQCRPPEKIHGLCHSVTTLMFWHPKVRSLKRKNPENLRFGLVHPVHPAHLVDDFHVSHHEFSPVAKLVRISLGDAMPLPGWHHSWPKLLPQLWWDPKFSKDQTTEIYRSNKKNKQFFEGWLWLDRCFFCSCSSYWY